MEGKVKRDVHGHRDTGAKEKCEFDKVAHRHLEKKEVSFSVGLNMLTAMARH